MIRLLIIRSGYIPRWRGGQIAIAIDDRYFLMDGNDMTPLKRDSAMSLIERGIQYIVCPDIYCREFESLDCLQYVA